MNALCEVCNKEKEHCFICKGRSATGCVEHSSTMTKYDCKTICKACLSLHKCTVNIAEKEKVVEQPVSKIQKRYLKNNTCNSITSSIINFFYPPRYIKEIIPIVIECNNIKKWCPTCRKKETINCPVHNPNIKNTCDECVKLLLCQKCNETKETTWSHKCGMYCSDCVKKIEIDVSTKTLCNLFEDISTEYILFSKWVICCKDCIEGSVLDVQKKEYFKLLKTR